MTTGRAARPSRKTRAGVSAPFTLRRQGPGGGEHERAHLVEIAFAQQTDRRTILQVRVQTLEPRLHDPGRIVLGEQ